MSGAAKVILGLTPLLGPSMIGAAGLLSGIGSYQDARNQADVYAAYERNARQQAKNEADREREKYRKLSSSRRAAMGASGLDVNSGSALDVLADTEAEGEVSAMRLLYGGELEASNWRRRAADAKKSGRNAVARSIGAGAGLGILGGQELYSRYFDPLEKKS